MSLNWSREKDLSQYLSVYSSARAMIDSMDAPPPAGALRWSFWGGDSWRERFDGSGFGGGVPPDRRRDSGGMGREGRE